MFIGIAVAVNSDTIMFRYIDLIDDRTGQILQLKEKRNATLKAFQKINIFNNILSQFLDPKDLMEFNIDLKQENIDFFNKEIQKALDMSSDMHKKGEFVSIYDNNFSETSNTNIYFNGEKYQGKIKLHGKTKFHWKNPKKSFSVKLKKGNLIEGMSNFIFIVPDEQLLATLFSYDVSKKYGYMNVTAGLARLKFNNLNQGIYILEEKLSRELLKNNGHTDVDAIKVIDEWSDQYLAQHITPFTNESSYAEINSYSDKNQDQLLKYETLMREGNSLEDILDIIDFERFALHEAMRILFGDDHAVAGDNLTLLYDNERSKFFPHFRMEGYLEKLEYSDFSKTFDKELNTYFMWEIRLFSMLNQNQKFRTLRNRYLHRISEDADILIGIFDNYIEEYSEIIIRDETNNLPSRWYFNEINRQRENLSYNLREIRRYLNYARVYSSLQEVEENTYKLTITPDSNSKLSLDNIFLSGLSSQEIIGLYDHQKKTEYSIKIKDVPSVLDDVDFSLELDENLEVSKNIFYYTIKLTSDQEINDYRLSFTNDIDGTKIGSRNIFHRNYIR